MKDPRVICSFGRCRAYLDAKLAPIEAQHGAIAPFGHSSSSIMCMILITSTQCTRIQLNVALCGTLYRQNLIYEDIKRALHCTARTFESRVLDPCLFYTLSAFSSSYLLPSLSLYH